MKSNTFVALLGLLFIGLKLTGFIHWSWIWVFAPLWVGFAILAILLMVIGITATYSLGEK